MIKLIRYLVVNNNNYMGIFFTLACYSECRPNGGYKVKTNHTLQVMFALFIVQFEFELNCRSAMVKTVQ